MRRMKPTCDADTLAAYFQPLRPELWEAGLLHAGDR
jgi:hypothetical protein